MDASSSPTKTAISTASATFALIAGAISVASAFAYIIAFKYLTGYFFALGCDWAINLYTPTQIIQTASPIAVIIAGLGFTIWNGYPAFSKVQVSLKTICIFAVPAAACYGIHLLMESFAPSYRSYFDWAAYCLAALGVFAAATKLVQRIFFVQGVEWGSIILVLLTAFSLFLFSGDRGRSAGRDTIAQENGRGSTVRIKGSQGTYRLARVVPYDRALVFSETADGKRAFRVVPITDVSISSRR